MTPAELDLFAKEMNAAISKVAEAHSAEAVDVLVTVATILGAQLSTQPDPQKAARYLGQVIVKATTDAVEKRAGS